MIARTNLIAKKVVRPIVAFAVLLMLLACLTIQTTAYAAQSSTGTDNSNTASSSAQFYVSAVIPDNQIDTSVSYFDLLMKPEDEQSLAVRVTNEASEDIVVDVSAISASTNRNGIIDYQTPDIKDESLVYPFSELSEIKENTVTIPANSTATVYVDIKMPEEEYDGVILGGIVITRLLDEEIESESSASESEAESSETSQSSTTIVNKYSYVVGVKLTETDTEVLPDFELVTVSPELVNYNAAVVHYLRNTQAYIVKGMDTETTITNLKDSTTVYQESRTIDMAPNSVMPVVAYPESGELEAGEYESVITLTYKEEEWDEEKVWELRQTFTIEASEANEINNSVPSEKTSIPMWAIILIILLVIFIVLIIILIAKRRKEDEKTK